MTFSDAKRGLAFGLMVLGHQDQADWEGWPIGASWRQQAADRVRECRAFIKACRASEQEAA